MATSFSGGRKWSAQGTTDHGQATGKLYNLRLQVECTHFSSLEKTQKMVMTFKLVGFLIFQPDEGYSRNVSSSSLFVRRLSFVSQHFTF
jgi:hypothetical protein